ncbi:hypothetical protein ACNVED_09535 [Legionella sp. D16C41]
MKKLLFALIVASSSLTLAGCGFGAMGCCPDYSAVSYTTTSCCSSNW